MTHPITIDAARLTWDGRTPTGTELRNWLESLPGSEFATGLLILADALDRGPTRPEPVNLGEDLDELADCTKLFAEAMQKMKAATDSVARKSAADERDRLTAVAPCSETYTEPFDFAYCSTHDRTFGLGDHCDYAGLSEVDYMEKQATEQRVRAIRAEHERDRLAAALRQIAEACHWSHDPSDDPEALSAYIGQLQRSADDALDAAAAAERIRALHERDGEGFCVVCDYMTPHPCPTLRALDGADDGPTT